MIEPGVRYLPHVPLPPTLPTHITLEAAVDLTKKSGEDWRPQSAEAEDQDDTDSDTPLDMSVTATSRLTPVFSRDISPAPSDRSDKYARLSGFYSPGSAVRDWSMERSEADRGTDSLYFSSFDITFK